MNTPENNTKKILVIEDEEILCEIISKKLKEEGYQVFTAADGIEGMEKLRELTPDLVLLDIVMPKMDGMEVLEQMRRDSLLKGIPVVVISNSGQQSEIERVVGLGVKDYVIKAQFSPDDVLEKVKKYLNQEYQEMGTHSSEHKTRSKNIKILLVEDDQFLSSLVASRLGKEGYTILNATDGKEVLKVVSENTPDLILLDIVMPEMNGFEVLKEIRSNKKYNDVIIIIFSNLGQDHEVEDALKAGANAFFVKVNFTLKEVVEKITALLAEKGKK